MGDPLDGFARRHGLSAPALHELRELLTGPSTQDTLVLNESTSSERTEPETLPSGLRLPRGDGSRYRVLSRLGRGSSGDVWRVFDSELNRTMAMKVLDQRVDQTRWQPLARFVREAQTTAQLAHPAIVPVHELGTLHDKRLYFTMEEVQGRTLTEAIAEVHHASRDVWSRGDTGWTLRRLVEVFRTVCEAVAYAHSRGVVHRDLKTDNVMVGSFGDVRVMDWGLARLLGESCPVSQDPITTNHHTDATVTRAGTIAGTPMYMAPEQAAAELDRIDRRTDVYALGAMLYFLLKDAPPFAGRPSSQVLVAVVRDEPEPLVGRPDGPILPEPLVRIATRAMHKDPDQRHPDAGALAAEIADWLDGAERREAAMRAVQAAAVERRHAVRLRREARKLRAQPEWQQHDHAARHERQARERELGMELHLNAAFAHFEQLPEAHLTLARLYRDRHRAAEQRGDVEDVERYELLLRRHVDALPPEWPGRHRVARYLEGMGCLSLDTEPAGARVLLYRLIEQDRRMVPTDPQDLGTTPIEQHPLPRGRYLLALQHPERSPVRVPVRVGRLGHVADVPPGAEQPTPLVLPATDLDEDQVWIAGGWCPLGGDPHAANAGARRRAWVPTFVLQRDPVTHREWLAWLSALQHDDSPGEAFARVPKSADCQPLYERSEGTWHLPEALSPDHPVTSVTWHDAHAYAAWRAELDGVAWRLPTEAEWEKAARGPGGRLLPWGDCGDPSWARLRDGQHAGPGPVGGQPHDVSPYGVRGMAGNVSDWCADPFHHSGPADAPVLLRTVRGGSFAVSLDGARAAARLPMPADERAPHIGLRLARSLEGQEP